MLENIVEADYIRALVFAESRREIAGSDVEPSRTGVIDHLHLRLDPFGTHPTASRCFDKPAVCASDIEESLAPEWYLRCYLVEDLGVVFIPQHLEAGDAA
ncbi:MAG TPA: hypothetical protein VIC06_04020 [Solirubrobacteraceae bacterium]